MNHLIALPLIVTLEEEVNFKNEKEAIECLKKNNFSWNQYNDYQFTSNKKFLIANLTQKTYFVRFGKLDLLIQDSFVICKTVKEFIERVQGTYIDPEETVYFIDNVFPFMFKGKVVNKENDNYAIVSAIGIHYVKEDKVFKTEEDMTKLVAECSMKLMKKEINKEQAFASSIVDMVKKAVGSDFDIDLIYSHV